jgi:hypothetical protein
MSRPTPEQLRESLDFVAQTIAAYTNSLDMVARKPFAEHAGVHVQRIVQSTQLEPEKEKEKK